MEASVSSRQQDFRRHISEEVRDEILEAVKKLKMKHDRILAFEKKREGMYLYVYTADMDAHHVTELEKQIKKDIQSDHILKVQNIDICNCVDKKHLKFLSDFRWEGRTIRVNGEKKATQSLAVLFKDHDGMQCIWSVSVAHAFKEMNNPKNPRQTVENAEDGGTPLGECIGTDTGTDTAAILPVHDVASLIENELQKVGILNVCVEPFKENLENVLGKEVIKRTGNSEETIGTATSIFYYFNSVSECKTLILIEGSPGSEFARKGDSGALTVLRENPTYALGLISAKLYDGRFAVTPIQNSLCFLKNLYNKEYSKDVFEIILISLHELYPKESQSNITKSTSVVEGGPQQDAANGHSYRAEPESVASESFPTDSGGSEATPAAVAKMECLGYLSRAAVSKSSVIEGMETLYERANKMSINSPVATTSILPRKVPYAYNDIRTTLLFDKNKMTLDDAKKVAHYIIEKMQQHGVTEDVRLYADGLKSRSNLTMEQAIDEIRSSKSSTLVHFFRKALNFTAQIASSKGEPRTSANQLNRLIVLSGVPLDDTSNMVKEVGYLVKKGLMGNTEIHFLLLVDEPNAPTPRKQITSQRTTALEHCSKISASTNGSAILLHADEEGTCQDKVDRWFERTWKISSSPQKHPSLKAGLVQSSPNPNGAKPYPMSLDRPHIRK